jgi:hypothetical protein
MKIAILLCVLSIFECWCFGTCLQLRQQQQRTSSNNNNQHFEPSISRRSILSSAVAMGSLLTISTIQPANAAQSNGLPLNTASSSGLKWADAKVGSGQPLKVGNTASIDYSMASTVGRLPQIYSTKDKGAPYRWVLGSGTTIEGIEKAILGDEEIPPYVECVVYLVFSF